MGTRLVADGNAEVRHPRTLAAMEAASATGLLPLVGDGITVETAGGETRRYVDLDSAASTRALVSVKAAVDEVLPWYASVHRGAGQLSKRTTDRYEDARRQVLEFVGGGPDDVVIFTRHTTEALNIAAHCLPWPDGHAVLTSLVEHHANLLPWRRRGRVVHLEPAPSAEALLDAVGDALRRARPPVATVTLTGASNVTGEVMPVADLAALAHEHGAHFVLDAAQLAPHRRIEKAAWGVDALALSGHKLYAPFGTGALVVNAALVAEAEPLLAGGGAVDFVADDDVLWTRPPYRHEAGTPNVIGAVALGAACAALGEVGMDAVADHERHLVARLDDALAGIPRLRRYRQWPEGDRLAVAAFNIDGMDHGLVAAVLANEYAIGVRDGCFCAHPYMTRLLEVDAAGIAVARDMLRRGEKLLVPGAVRASFGIGSNEADVDALADALRRLATDGPAFDYAADLSACAFQPEISS